MGVIKVDPLFRQIVERLPPTVAFNDEQIEALKGALIDLNWKRHVVDIRLSTLGFYLILLGGTERRSQKRLATEGGAQPLLTRANLVVFVLLSLLLGLAGIGAICQLSKLLISV